MKKTEKVMIVSAKAGAGHIRAALALEKAFEAEHPETEIKNIDILEYASSAFRKTYSEGYEKLIRQMPSLWGYIYEKTENKQNDSRLKKLTSMIDKLNTLKFVKAVKDFDPDVVLCTHFVPIEVLSSKRGRGRLKSRLEVVLTDYEIHAMWVYPNIDRYFVATGEMAFALREKGIEPDRIRVKGIPIMPEFRNPPDKKTIRKKLGIDPGQTTVLVSAGGDGLADVTEMVKKLLERHKNVTVLAVAGKNQAIEKKLRDLAESFHGQLVPFGFVNNMHELMAASDFTVAKCGGLTTSESLATGLPMVIIHPIPGQEDRNADYLLENGAALRANNPAQMLYKVKLLLDSPDRLAKMVEAARKIARPDAAFDIADTVTDEKGNQHQQK